MFSIYSVLLVLVCFLICYGFRMLGWFSNFRAQKHIVNKKQNKLALFIPARDEGAGIVPLLESIKNQTYPKELISTFIVVKNPNDEAYEYAKLVNGVVFCDPNQKCKGDCTDYSFKKLLSEYEDSFDAVVMVDADTTLDEHFLEEMNNSLATGAQVAIAKKRVRNYFVNGGKNSNFVTESNGLLWTMVDEMGSRFKADHGITVTTISNGILFTKEFIRSMGGWSYLQTLTEDMELERDCALRNIKTYYNSYAIVYTEEAPSLAVTDMRRSRWFSGLIQSDYLYFWKFVRGFNKQNAANIYMVFSMWFSFLYFACLAGMPLVNLVCIAVKYATTWVFDMPHFLSALASLGLIYVSFMVLVLSAIIAGRHDVVLPPLKAIRLVIFGPFFYMGYFPIIARGIFGKNEKSWVAVERIESAVEAISASAQKAAVQVER